MDSRVKRQVIIAVSFIFLCIIAMVFVVNYIQTGYWFPGQEKQTTDETTEPEDDSALDTQAVPGSIHEKYNLDPTKDPYAFLADDEFFDREPGRADSENSEKSLSLLVTSAEKDLRIYIVDETGTPAAGESFRVALNTASGQAADAEIYRDLDKDGMIYIGGLIAGDYLVSLQESGNYNIQSGETAVTVKDRIEYTVLNDISFLIKSESEIDPSIDDTETKDAEKEENRTEVTDKISGGNDTGFGIDVSKWNRAIDWEKAKDDGVEFAIIRLGYRGSSTGSLVEDPYFKTNIEGAIAADIKVGVYFFTQATNTVEAVEEASMVLALCKGYELAYPMFIDTEGAGGNGRADGLDQTTRTDVCRAFCETIENSGMNAGVYASKSWYNNNLHVSRLEDYTIWLAQYNETVTYEGDYDMWQYTSSGAIDGIQGRVDLNISYRDF